MAGLSRNGTTFAGLTSVLRITRMPAQEPPLRLKVEGRLVGPWLAVLDAELARYFADEGTFALDLSGVDYASREGAELLRRARDRGARVVACSPLLENLLSGEAP